MNIKKAINLANDMINVFNDYAYSLDLYFKDVNKENWFYEDISIGVKAGYINGKSKDIFNA